MGHTVLCKSCKFMFVQSKQSLLSHHNLFAQAVLISFNLMCSRAAPSERFELFTRHGVTHQHYDDVIMTTIASQITSLTSVYSTAYSDADQRKHQSSASLAFVSPGPVNSPHKGPVTRKMFPFDDVIMGLGH